MNPLFPAALLLTLSASLALGQTATVGSNQTAKKPTAGEKQDLAFDTFDKDELPGLRLNFTCFENPELDQDELNRKACEHVMRMYESNTGTEILGGMDVSSTLARKVENGQIKVDGGTVFTAPFERLKLPVTGFAVEEKTVESVSQKSGFLFTVQKAVKESESLAEGAAKKIKELINPEVQFFGLYAERADGHTAPFMAAAVQFRHEIKRVGFLDKLGVKKVNITVLTNPFAALAIPQIRSAVMRDPEFEATYKEAAEHHISAATGIPVELVPILVPQAKLQQAYDQAKAVATQELKHRVSYANGIRTMLNEAYATFFLTETVKDEDGKDVPKGKRGWTVRIGKISPNQQRSLLDDSTNLMFPSVYQISARMSTRTYAVTATVGAQIGPQESAMGGLVEAYVRAMVERGADYFKLKPNTLDVNLELKQKWFQERGIPFLTGLMVGGGGTSNLPFGYVRVDASHGPISGNYMGYWLACNSNSNEWYGCFDHNRSVQTRQYGLVKAELHEFKNKYVRGVSKVIGETKVETYSTKGSAEPFTLVRLVGGRKLPKMFQYPFSKVGAEASLEGSWANVFTSATHHEPGRRVQIFGAGLVLSFGK